MALTQYTADTDIIETLGTNPEDRPALTDDTFKAKFDENSENIKVFLNAMIAELASTANGKGASQIGIEDSGSKFTATNVEAALAESATLISTHTADLITESNGAHGLKIQSGTWTPTLAGSTTAGSNTYTYQYGYYQKIGNTVIAHGFLTTSAVSGMVGELIIKGLPYAATGGTFRYSNSIIGSTHGITYSGHLGALVRDSQNYINLYGNSAPLNYTAAAAATNIAVTAIYQTAS